MSKNAVFVAVRFGMYTVSGVLFIPYLVEHYGSAPYGLIALAGFLTQYVGMIARCIGNATARFLNIALNKDEWQQANEIFSTALIANLGLILMQIPFFCLGIWKLDWVIDFPPELAIDFKILVSCNVLIFFISMLTGVFLTPIQAANRLDISATLETINLSLRMVFLIVLVETVGARLWLVGVVDIALTLLYGIVIFIMYRKLAHGLVFKLACVTRKWIGPVMKMAAWSIVVVLGASLCLKTDVWMINRFVSREMAGVYAALLVWPNFMKQISKQLATVLEPVYMIDYARGDIERVARLSLFGAKLLGCLMASIAGFVFVFAEPLLRLWLGDWVVQYAHLLRLLIIYVVFIIGQEVLWQIYVAMNKVHFTGVVSLLTGIVNVAVSMSLIWAGFGVIGVATGTVVAEVLGASLAVPLGVCHIMGISPKVVVVNHLGACAMLLSSWAAATVAQSIWHHTGIGAVLSFGLFFLAGSALVVVIFFNRSEKQYMDRLLHDILMWIRKRRSALRE